MNYEPKTADDATTVYHEPILQFFAWEHLPPHLQEVSRPFAVLANAIAFGDDMAGWRGPMPRNAERSVALRKLLEAKDAAVRAMVAK